ncbi:MAG: DUF4249 domain-containing protein [Bacteroidales bacterium]|nr:DUF4249 domain-containing protein [Bacteroidales bacterium]
MKKYRGVLIILTLFIATLLLAFPSCRKVVTDKFPDYPQMITVNSIVKAGEPLVVNVSLTGNINDSVLHFVDNAEVLLYVNGCLAETLSYEGDGYYASTVTASENDSLECVVAYNGDTAKCSCVVPHKEIPLGFEYTENAGVDDYGEVLQGIKTTISNVDNRRKYYEIKIYTIEGTDYYGGTFLMDITDPIIKNEGLPLPLFSNELASGDQFSVNLKFMPATHGWAGGKFMYRPILVRFRTVDENYYKFTRMHYLYTEGRYSDGIVDNPVMFNAYSNVENGYGVFAAYTEYVDTVYPPDCLY